jgi:hypothetical protein
MHPRLSAARTWKRALTLGAATVVGLGITVTPASAIPTTATGKPLAAPGAPASPAPLTEGQALARARATGAAVAVTSATTATETLTANPDGHLTLTRTAMPARRLVDGAWKDLDATLHLNPNGAITPAVASSDLTLSGGGTGPLATLSGSGYRLALSMPMTLPTPELSGPTATYRNIIPDVDLVATATEQGGFSEVMVVRTAAAAADPRLSTLTLATKATGVTLTSDAAGNISGVDKLGRTVIAAPAPQLWDSSTTTAAGATARPRSTGADPNTSLPATSSADGPGVNAQHAALAVQATATAITLTPDKALMASPTLTYPVYLDPSFVQPTISNHYSGWSTINKAYPSTKYWNSTPDPHPEKDMQVGTPDETNFISRSLINFSIPYSTLGAAGNVSKATLQVNEDWAYSCSARTVNLYAPASATLTSANAYWNAWAGVSLGSAVDSANVAHGYNSSCPAANVGFDVLSTVRTDVTGKKGTQTFMLKAADETDKFSWKEFTHPSSSVGPILTIQYNHTPNTPSAPKTNPASACAGGGAIGLGPVSLTATVSDPDGGTVGATFKLVNHGTGATVQTSDPQVTHATSGQAVSFALDQSKLNASANKAITQFDWSVTATDYKATSGAATCHFTFDPTTPGAPAISDPPDGVIIGQTVSFTASPSGTLTPGAYLVQVNGAAPVRHTASNGIATFSVKPTRLANTLSVTSVSSTGTNIGQPSDRIFNAAAPTTPTVDQDLTGDGIPDLLAAGGPGAALPSGLWVGSGNRTTGVDPIPADIGMYGDRLTGGLPSDFDGSHAISGLFAPDAGGLQDIMAYQPQGAAANEGGGEILEGSGDGSPIDPSSGEQHTISAGALDDQFDYPNPVAPLQLVNAGNTSQSGHAYPDLIGIGGDATDGYTLWYYNSEFQPGVFDGPYPMLGVLTPTGGSDWNTWTLASAQIGGQTDLYLWQKSTGALYLWRNLFYSSDDNSFDYSPTAFGTWNAGASLTLQAADIDGNSTPDLWALGSGGTATAWLNNGTSLTSLNQRTLATAAHTWQLAEGTTDGAPITTAADTTGTLNVTGNSGVTWNTGGLFDPDASFNGTSGALAAGAAAVNTGADFTVSAWVRPKSASGYVLSQDGAHQASFVLYPGSDNFWYFGMSQSDTGTATYDLVHNVTEGPVHYNVWQHITASYNAATKTMALYINGNPVFSGVRTTSTTSTAGKLQIGDRQFNGTHTGYFNGEIANVQTWNQTLSPDQIADISGTPDHILFRSNNTTYRSGSTWTGPYSTATFSQGQLSIKETGSKSGTVVNFGATGYPDAILILQADGNLVIYKTSTSAHTAANAVWSTATYSNPNDSMFLQPDGNLVIYSAIGKPIWSAGTYNPSPL